MGLSRPALLWAIDGPIIVTVLRLWLAATAVLLAAILVWAFAPVLLFFLLLTAGLGLVSALMIGLARGVQAWRARRGEDGEP
jgi:hypothetical protein